MNISTPTQKKNASEGNRTPVSCYPLVTPFPTLLTLYGRQE